jgi:hypothetical protein
VFYELIRFAADGAERAVAEASRQLDALVPTDVVPRRSRRARADSVAPLMFRRFERPRGEIRSRPAASTCLNQRRRLSSSAPARAVADVPRGRPRWDPAWVAPGGTPVQFLEDCGFLDARVLAVHGVQMSPEDLNGSRRAAPPS